jgi:hypothetical protein
MAVETLDELHSTIGNLIRTASGVNAVILANQDHAPPPGTYGTYHLMPVRAYGHPRRDRADIAAAEPVPTFAWTDIAETTVTQLELMVSVNFFDSGAKQAALMMQQAQFRSPVSEYCYVNGIAWRYTSESRDLTGLEMATIQERYQVDLHLWVETAITDTILRAAGFSVTIEDEGGNALNQFTKTEAVG